MQILRQKTVLSRMAVTWDFPVVAQAATAADAGAQKGGEATVARSVQRALEREEAFARIAGDDPRPLLVLRECAFCNDTDDALLSREVSNEKTFVMSRWFHCVKLPISVVEPDHPFHSLFPQKDPPHLYVCSPDGSDPIALRGDQSQGELWKAMFAVLRREYRDKPEKATKAILQLHIEFDKLDAERDLVDVQLERELARNGKDSRKAKQLRARLADLDARMETLLEKEAELYALALKRPAAEQPAATAG